jgi:hypothetical protein
VAPKGDRVSHKHNKQKWGEKMSTKSYIFAGILAATTATNAYATGENIMTSKSYVDSVFQTKIPVGNLSIEYENDTLSVPNVLVSAPTVNAGQIGEYGILDDEFADSSNIDELYEIFDSESFRNTIPTTGIMGDYIAGELNEKQNKVPKSGYSAPGEASVGAYNTNAASDNQSWLNANVKGSGLVTRTSYDGVVGERKIFEASDLTNYHAQNLTQNQKDIQDISIPTVGVMMSAISSGITAAAPTGTANTIANYDANGALGSGIATYTGAAAYNATNDSAKIPTMAGVATYAQAKKVCAGWPDGTTTPDSTHTDANCWLWTLPD